MKKNMFLSQTSCPHSEHNADARGLHFTGAATVDKKSPYGSSPLIFLFLKIEMKKKHLKIF